MVQGSHKNLQGGLHQGFSGVGEDEVVVRHQTHADRVVTTAHIEERREDRQGMAVLTGGEVRHPSVDLATATVCKHKGFQLGPAD